MRVAIGSATTTPISSAGGDTLKVWPSNAISQAISLPPAKDWSSVLQRSLDRFRIGSLGTASPDHHMRQMTDLLRIQSDISRYQLKVELVSKVSEGAVASVRKLQQNQ